MQYFEVPTEKEIPYKSDTERNNQTNVCKASRIHYLANNTQPNSNNKKFFQNSANSKDKNEHSRQKQILCMNTCENNEKRDKKFK